MKRSVGSFNPTWWNPFEVSHHGTNVSSITPAGCWSSRDGRTVFFPRDQSQHAASVDIFFPSSGANLQLHCRGFAFLIFFFSFAFPQLMILFAAVRSGDKQLFIFENRLRTTLDDYNGMELPADSTQLMRGAEIFEFV